MNETQTILLEMYKDIKSVLERNGIRFYSHFGTSIGAIRHNGFIPWDDDMDLLVWEDDLDRVRDALTTELDGDKYYYNECPSDSHPHIIYRGVDLEQGLRDEDLPFIDLFTLVPYPDKPVNRFLTDTALWGFAGSIHVINKLENVALYRLFRRIPRFFKWLSSLTTNKDTSVVTVCTTNFKKNRFPLDYFGTPVVHPFEDTDVPLPCETDRMLTELYGDYMTPPPEDKRTGAGGFPCSAYSEYIVRKKS
ncbi:MAG: LicD family protein [Candidatus Methanomethylophilaceae archaeon]|nr:LicD family protein [Candidatus Methanomethylophilaceae archaeon]